MEITQEPCWLWCSWDEGHTFSVYPERLLREVFGELCPGACAPGFCPFQCWGCVVSGPSRPSGCLVLLKNHRHSLCLKSHCLTFIIQLSNYAWSFHSGCLRWASLHGVSYIHRCICIVFSVFSNQGVVEVSTQPHHLLDTKPCPLPAACLFIFNSLDFNVFLYRAGKGPHGSLGHEKEGFGFLTKWNQQ